MTLKGSCPVREGGLVSSVFRRLASYLMSADGLRREAAWRNVVTPEGIQVPSESLGLSIVGHSMM
jgi:hypothetical protein